MGDSIFEFADEFGIDSPFANDWIKDDFKDVKSSYIPSKIGEMSVIPDYNPSSPNMLSSTPSNVIISDSNVQVALKVVVRVTTTTTGAVSITLKGGATMPAINTYNSFEYEAKFKVFIPRSKVKNDKYNTKDFVFTANLRDRFDVNATDEKTQKVTINAEGRIVNTLNKVCYCDRYFTLIEMQKIISEIRKSTFYNKKSIFSYYTDKLFSNESQLPDEQKNYEKMNQVLNDTFKKYEINTCIRKIHFLAQAYWETGYFTRTKEVGKNLKYDPYRGRGFMQLTGVVLKSGNVVAGIEDSRTKNATAYLGYKKYTDLDVVSSPDLISKSLNISADSGGWFWKYGKLLSDGTILDLNTIADEDNISRISFLVNGGQNGKQERIDAYIALKKVMKYENCINKI
jgi:predicted chitinase